jgi:Ca-activated chloride channel family protein
MTVSPPYLLLAAREYYSPIICTMRQLGILCRLLALTLFADAHHTRSQTIPAAVQTMPPATFNVSIDEVSLTFHAADQQGLPVADLKPSDLIIYDNYRLPRKILAFQALRDAPIRAGILLDTSVSMERSISHDRAVSTEYVERLLRPKTDLAFIEYFGYIPRIVEAWTGNQTALARGIREATVGRANPRGGTAIFDTVFSACLYQFGKTDHHATGNFILLFTDGEDNTSHVDLKGVVDVCQRTNTAIYAFYPEPSESSSPGPSNLALLTSQTGGRLFHLDDSEVGISKDLNTIESDLRNQYWMVYRPAELRHDGRFHQIYVGLSGQSDKVTIDVRSGYYAPDH